MTASKRPGVSDAADQSAAKRRNIGLRILAPTLNYASRLRSLPDEVPEQSSGSETAACTTHQPLIEAQKTQIDNLQKELEHARSSSVSTDATTATLAKAENDKLISSMSSMKTELADQVRLLATTKQQLAEAQHQNEQTNTHAQAHAESHAESLQEAANESAKLRNDIKHINAVNADLQLQLEKQTAQGNNAAATAAAAAAADAMAQAEAQRSQIASLDATVTQLKADAKVVPALESRINQLHQLLGAVVHETRKVAPTDAPDSMKPALQAYATIFAQMEKQVHDMGIITDEAPPNDKEQDSRSGRKTRRKN